MNLINKLAVLTTIFLCVACTTTLNPHDFDTNDLATLNLKGVKPLAVKARITGNKASVSPLPGGDVIFNEDEFTRVLVDRMISTLQHNNVSIVPDSDRTIEIQVVKVSIEPSSTIYCVLDFNRKLDKQEFYGFQSRAKHWNFKTACEQAINNAVNDLLLDQNTIRYLKGE